MQRVFIAAALCLLVFAPVADAQVPTLLFSTNFNSPTYTDGALVPVSGPAQDNWTQSGTSVVTPIAVSNTASNGLVSLASTGQDVQRALDGGQVITSGSVFFKATINVTAALSTGDYFMHFTDGGTMLYHARTYIRSSGAGFTMAVGTGSGTAVTYGTTVLSLGTNYDILVRYDVVEGANNDTGALFVNPVSVDGSGDTPYVNATTVGSDTPGIRAIALRQGTASNAPTLTVDNIEVFTVTPVPEPATFLGVAAGVLGLARVVRRRVAVRA